ncbi:hypothetical protein [Propionivibrio sp.]|uniref:hypothetical protein n=1 Tax=Propionivibrio sp. TaxID=2212460 RepID=UPI003BF26CC3
MGKFILWEHGRISILCGDFFQLSAADLGDVAAVFDRASLTALPEEIRGDYLEHLRKILPAACKIFLLTTEEPDDDETQEQPFAVADEITGLYAHAFDIKLSYVESLFEPDPDPDPDPDLDTYPAVERLVRIEQKVYLLTPKAD